MTRPPDGAPDSKLVLEQIDGGRGPRPGAAQRLDYWCKFDPPAILKRYIRGKFSVCFKLRVWLTEIDGEYYCAFFSNFPGSGVAKAAYCVVPGSSISSLSTAFEAWFWPSVRAASEPSWRGPVAVFLRRGARLSTTSPLRGLARPMTFQ